MIKYYRFTLKKSGSIEIDEDSLDCYDNPEDKIESGTRLNKRLALLLDAGCANRTSERI